MASSSRYAPLMMMRAPNGLEAIVMRDDHRGGVAATSGKGSFREDGDPGRVADRIAAWLDSGTRTAAGRNVDSAFAIEPAMRETRSAPFVEGLAAALPRRPGTSPEAVPRLGVPSRGPGADPLPGMRNPPRTSPFPAPPSGGGGAFSLAASVPLPAAGREDGEADREARVHLHETLPVAAVETGSRRDAGRGTPAAGAVHVSPAGAARLSADVHATAAAEAGRDPDAPVPEMRIEGAGALHHEELVAGFLSHRRTRAATFAAHADGDPLIGSARERSRLLRMNSLSVLDPSALMDEADQMLGRSSGTLRSSVELPETGPAPVWIGTETDRDGNRLLHTETHDPDNSPGTIDLEARDGADGSVSVHRVQRVPARGPDGRPATMITEHRAKRTPHAYEPRAGTMEFTIRNTVRSGAHTVHETTFSGVAETLNREDGHIEMFGRGDVAENGRTSARISRTWESGGRAVDTRREQRTHGRDGPEI